MRNRGFSLVELLAAISVASIALGMLASAVKSQGSTAVFQMGSADMQQNVRGALDLFRREVRMAGYGMSGVPSATLPILSLPSPADGELYRVNLFGNYGFVKSRVNTGGVAEGATVVPLTPVAAGVCLGGTPEKRFTVGQRVSIESALRGVADVYTIGAYDAVNCTITVSPSVVAGGYDAGSPVNEIQQVTYVLGANNVLTRDGMLAADQIDALEMDYILRDGTEVDDPAAVLADLRSATIRLRSQQEEHDGLRPQAELATEVRIRNLAIVRSPMIDNL